MRVDAFDRGVDGLHGPGQILREAGVVGLVDLQLGGAGTRQLLQLEVQRAAEIERELGLAGIEVVPDPLHERVRP